ncbi:hypothetical protein V8E36_001084 [Tilletia maclaganii]
MVGCFSLLSRRRQSSAGSTASNPGLVAYNPRSEYVMNRDAASSPSPPQLPAYSPPGTALLNEVPELSGILKDLGRTIESTVFGLSGELRTLALKMFDAPELAFEERKTHDLFCNWFEKNYTKAGWKVTRHAWGMETAFQVEFEHKPENFKGVPKTIGFMSELDALPGIGHACGHPLIAICGVAGALATAEALVKHNLPGKVVLLGTPAEEAGGGKVILINAGAYKKWDVSLMAHPGPFSTVGSSLAVSSFRVTYRGKTAHAAALPWAGINALDAAVQAYVNMSTLRQQVPPSHRMHAIIQGQNMAVNVIPDEVHFIVNARAPTKPELEALNPRVSKCFEAAALATGCKYEVETSMTYLDLENSSPLTETFKHVMASKYESEYAADPMVGSTDAGDVSYVVPSIHPLYAIPLPDVNGDGNHTRGFEKAAREQAAHKKTLEVAVGLALTGVKIVADEDYAEEVRRTFDEWKKGNRPKP